jgi:hypothetical protein
VRSGFTPEYLEQLDLLQFNSVVEEITRQEILDRVGQVSDANQAAQGDVKSIKAHIKSLKKAAGVRNTISRDDFVKGI